MERHQVDHYLRSELRRWSIIGGACAVVLLGVAVALLVIAGPSLGSLGVAGIAVLLAVVMLDSVVRFPRPAPSVCGGAVVVPSSRLVGVVVLLMGAPTSLLAVALITDDVTDQRAAWVRFAVPGVAALLALVGVVATVRPTRLVVSPDGVTSTGRRPRQIGWDDLTSVSAADEAIKGSSTTALPLVLHSAENRIDLQTRWTRPTLWVLVSWLEHYRHHPGDRGELAGPAGLARLHDTDARLRRHPSPTGPRWLPGPEHSR